MFSGSKQGFKVSDTETFTKKTSSMEKIIERIVLAGCAALVAWTAAKVVNLGELVATHTTMINVSTERMAVVEQVASEMKAMSVKLDQLKENQTQLKQSLDEHMRNQKR